MEPFTKLTAIACPFNEINVDTNQLCPTRFNKLPVGDPYLQKVMFHDQRFTRDGATAPIFASPVSSIPSARSFATPVGTVERVLPPPRGR